DGIRDFHVTGVQTCALPISDRADVLRELLGILNEIRIVDQGYTVLPIFASVPTLAIELFERSQLRIEFVPAAGGRFPVKLFPQLFDPLNDLAGVDNVIVLAELAHGGGSLCVWCVVGI